MVSWAVDMVPSQWRRGGNSEPAGAGCSRVHHSDALRPNSSVTATILISGFYEPHIHKILI
jgi:hypothetical protein